jgi:hypothetical protein
MPALVESFRPSPIRLTEFTCLDRTIKSGKHSIREQLRRLTLGKSRTVMDVIGTVFDNTIVSNEVMASGEAENPEDQAESEPLP